MSKKISEIYTEYKIPTILQEHMLRVAAVASIICDSRNDILPKEEIVKACLLHDMGNILKFKWDSLSEFLKPEGIPYWQSVQEEYRQKYGVNEHEATLKIIKEIGVSEKVLNLVAGVDFMEVFSALNKSVEDQIMLYSDCRVDPFGIVSFRDRLSEGRKRYVPKENKITDERWKTVESIFTKVEALIFGKCKIKPEDINNETVAPIISNLREFVVK